MSRPILFQCVVLENGDQDPLMLGRVRARILSAGPDTGSYEDIINAFDDPPWDPENDPWSERDPCIFNPLLPYFIYQTPKPNELIQVLYVNRDFKYQNQYYIQNNFYSPNSIVYQDNQGGNKFTGTGMQIKNPNKIKNNNGTYKNPLTSGVYPEPGDNALLGRGSADVIVKQNEVIIRAGKFSGVPQTNVPQIANTRRAYLQLSSFQSTIVPGKDKKTTTIEDAVVLVKYLIEWVITNPENTQNKFCGTVYLYQLMPDTTTNSQNLTVGSIINEKKKIAVSQEEFKSLSIDDTVKFINNFIQTCNNDNVTKSGKRLFPQVGDKFPIYYRPNNYTYNFIQSASSGPISQTQPKGTSDCPTGPVPGIEFTNLSYIFRNVKLNPALKQGGYGLIYSKNNVGQPQNIVIKKDKTFFNTAEPITIGALGADKIYFLSSGPTKSPETPINLSGTTYGIPMSAFTGDIITKTSSMVRGEELLELINLIVRFLTTHTHAYPGLPPVPVTQDGITSVEILTELQTAVTKILNENIRLN